MKNLIAIIIIGIGFSFQSNVMAQINEAKMDKDCRVASGALSTLVQGEDNRMMFGGESVEGNYLEGYGVIFSISANSVWVSGKPNYTYYGRVESGNTVVVEPKADSKEKVKESNKDELVKSSEYIKEVMVEFLADYSQLIGQLSPTDKIVVSTKKSDHIIVMSDDDVSTVDRKGSPGFTAELVKKDQNDYIQGKISRDQLIAKIKLTENTAETSRSKDLDLFGSMLRTVYNEEYTDTYFMSWKPEYEKIKGVGAIFSFKVYSSYEEIGGHRMPGISQKHLSDGVRDENVEKMYPEFIKGMKENIVQYGRTIKSLEDGELLILKITLTKCTDCSIPKKIQFSVKQDILRDFNSGKLKLEAAIAQVKMTELK